MSISKATFSKYINEFKIKELFNELGWDNAKAKYPIKANERLYSLTGIAQKRDFLILLCEPQDGESIPDAAERKKIDNVITKLHYEHLIVYIDGKKVRQHWELVVREHNKPIVCRPIDYCAGQQPELLFQKLEGLFFAYEDEEKLSIVDVRSRVMENFERNAAVVTKKFYERFQKEHQKFLKFIEGIQSKVDHEWYASLMLNRLMFIYFIQKKGFLDKNKDYLRTKLKAVQQKKGKNKFYSFYRNFLLVLFHKGLGSPLRDTELEAEIGKVPYLNGGLFDVHQIEQENKDISIEDKAFERLFEFFDEYNWHLDTRLTATGKDINPDVIGYIFEKYINDRAAMGAYYTKEDITEYISKNCIVPWLFDDLKRNYAKPFGIDGEIWGMLKQSSDKYIYPAVKHGIKSGSPAEDGFSDLPAEMQVGLDTNIHDLVEKRRCWSRPAPADIALPTEIYRELIARRKRYYEVRCKIEAGEITEINDFITYNLDIRQFAQDVLRETDDADLVRHFYKALKKITVLDPTCGSGAFLFAALNVLEPLYYECVKRMREFVEDSGKGKHKFFEEQLAVIDLPEHPSTEYFIYKSIILHNLYGVDIMKEAVEIAKLRLFLKLVATVDVDYNKPNLGLEPLPDIDFNIRSGNTLVGYATFADLDKSKQGGLFGDEEKQAILEEADIVSRTYARFKDAQLVMHSDPKTYKDAKDELNKRLSVLNDKFSRYLAVAYLGSTPSDKAYDKWLASHQPFHWLAEYYTTIAQGGFDVIIGNPPYIEYSKIKQTYTVRGFDSMGCGNIYTLVIENCMDFLNPQGRIGMITQNSIVCTKRMIPIQKLLVKQHTLYVSNFDDRPAKLFTGLNHMKGTVLLTCPINGDCKTFTTKFYRWHDEFREFVFQSVKYIELPEHFIFEGHISKISEPIHKRMMGKLSSQRLLGNSLSKSGKVVYCHRIASYFIKAVDFVPYFCNETEGEKKSEDYKEYFVNTDDKKRTLMALLNSGCFYLYWHTLHDGYHCGKLNIEEYPFDFPVSGSSSENNLIRLGVEISKNYKANSFRRETTYQSTGTVTYDEFYPKLSKLIIDDIDKVLAKHYGFTEEELDFIINYDIKYRMGKELKGEE